MGSLISEKDALQIKGIFDQQMQNPVTMRLFIEDPQKKEDCMYCSETQQIVEELGALSNKITTQVHENPDQEMKSKYGIERFPALILEQQNGEDSGVRFYGIPSGYEFGTLIEDIVDLSKGETRLKSDLVTQVQSIEQEVTIKVFVTPT